MGTIQKLRLRELRCPCLGGATSCHTERFHLMGHMKWVLWAGNRAVSSDRSRGREVVISRGRPDGGQRGGERGGAPRVECVRKVLIV